MSIGDINKYKFIGITGFAQSGKDETVKILNSIGYERVSLADPVRKGIYNINPWVNIDRLQNKELFLKFRPELLLTRVSEINIRLRDIVDKIGWEDAKKIPEVRRLLQFYGTEGGRQIFGNTIWTDTADKYIKDNNIKKVAVSDVRFPNELDWVRNKPNNLVIKIKRQGVGPINNHISDVGISDELCDFIIYNNGSLEDLKKELL